ncbi:hypothetical protein [Streptomyces bohaiensis]|uniref:hypothetical protein n=1 Tax=Streptomyces bohaiensis TaxID=1431344 RepID=UPI001FD808D4|nr:hypothetical protein [Streptomyces bohaiensis]
MSGGTTEPTMPPGLPRPAALPGVDRREPAAAGGFWLTPARAGLHLGTDRQGDAVSLPAPGPAGTRVGVLGESLFGRLFALRLLALGARVTAVSRVPEKWVLLQEAAGDRLQLVPSAAGWPAHEPEPPTVGDGPQVLVTDQRRAPSAAAADGQWRTVLHVTRSAPARSAFWSGADVVLALGASHAEAAGRVLGTDARRFTEELGDGEIALFRPGGRHVLRPDIAPAETELLTP